MTESECERQAAKGSLHKATNITAQSLEVSVHVCVFLSQYLSKFNTSMLNEYTCFNRFTN